MPTCQNPTLAQIPEYRRRELVDICRRYDVMIIEDDVYALSLEHNLRPLASLAPERCCFIASTSEALSGGLRIAYLCPPDAVFAELERTISYTISMGSSAYGRTGDHVDPQRHGGSRAGREAP